MKKLLLIALLIMGCEKSSPSSSQIEGDDDTLIGSTYSVYGGTQYIEGIDGYNPQEYGFILIGSNTETNDFYGNYNYYYIITQSGNIAYVDAVQGSNGNYYETNTTGNTIDYANVAGTPDGNTAAVGGEFDGTSGGYIAINALGQSLAYIKVYIVDNTNP